MLRVGIVGCGSVADFGHAPALARVEGVELTACYDPVPGRAEAFATKHGGIGFAKIQPFYATGLDAVIVCSPVDFHDDNVMEAAESGCHVLCEKPLTTSWEPAEAMQRAMDRSQKLLAIGMVYRFSQTAKDIYRWIREGVIGEIRSLRLVYLWHLHGQYVQDTSRWVESPLWRGRMLEGGPMVDCGVHQINLARWWLDSEVVNVVGAGAWVGNYESPDHVYAHLDHANGCHTMVEMSFTYGHTAKEPAPVFSYELIGTGGVIRYDREGWRLEIIDGRNSRLVPGAGEKNFDGMIAEFRDAIARKELGLLPDYRAGMRAMEIAQIATESAILRRKSLSTGLLV